MVSSYRDESRHPWRWMIAFSRFLWTFLNLGIFKSMGVFIPHIMTAMEVNTTVVGFVASAVLSVGGITAPFVGVLMTILDARQLVMIGGTISSFCVIAASFSTSIVQLGVLLSLSSIGLSLIQVSIVKPMMDYFPNNFATANGVSLCGGSIGMTLLPIAVEYMTSVYGWRNAMTLMGALSFNYVLCGALLRPLRRSKKLKRYGYTFLMDQNENDEGSKTAPPEAVSEECGHASQGINDTGNVSESPYKRLCQILSERFSVSLLKDGEFLLYLVVMFLCGVVHAEWHLFVIPLGLQLGFQDDAAARLAIFVGVGSLVGRVIHGPVVDRNLITASSAVIISCLLFAASCLLTPVAGSSYVALASLCFIEGVAIGVFFPLAFVLMREVSGDLYVTALGGMYLFLNLGRMAGGTLSGWIHDVWWNYEWVYLAVGVVAVLMAVTTGLARCVVKCRRPTLT